ncbi:hypothetical protein H5983_09860, partial [Faecalitalea cylindroides]|uniref:hypothetical protein n=1 Tax=Faecalitalea cylindroides TaxID=39483 RepID=UPI0019563CB0
FVNWTYGEGEAAGEAADVAAIRDITGLTKDTTFTAHFTEKTDIGYTVTYHYEGADSESSEKEGTFGKPMEYEAPEKKEYKG